ncbi:tail protein X [Sphingomonas sp.]|jgi:phage tail protein X|uniref:tail protein X n=1 Tax=Sphingomonas sp. TaxID=28214 RepID=UPI002EDB57F5
MADTVHARQGDTLDALLWRERRLGPPALAGVLAANPGLADLGAVLPLGTPVVIPLDAAAAPQTRTLVNLWD